MLAIQCLFVTLCVSLPSSLVANLYSREPTQQRRFSRHRLQQMQSLLRSPNLRRHQLPLTMNASDLMQLVPTTPSADEVDCHVEVEVVRSFGGRCVRLGGERKMSVCQSGMYLDVHSEQCRRLAQQDEGAESSDDDDLEFVRREDPSIDYEGK